MTFQAQISGHTDVKEDEATVIKILKEAHDKISEVMSGVITYVNASTHHGPGTIDQVHEVATAPPPEPTPEPEPPTPPMTPETDTTPPRTNTPSPEEPPATT